MAKIAGKIITYLLLIGCSVACASIKLEVHDVDGNDIRQIGVGQPFTLEVSIQGVNDTQVRPEIKGLENGYYRSNGVMITSINGHTKIKHKYRARFDTPGFYIVGPAKANDGGNQLISNTEGITVSEQASNPQAQTNQNQVNDATAFLKLAADKDHIVLGEKIKCSVKFYYSNEVTNLAPIAQQEIQGFSILDGNQAERGTETINGKIYNYIDLQWEMLANQVGKKTIPAYHADFTIRSHAHRNLQHLSMFLSTFGEQKRIYSNALTITVDPLPKHVGPVHGIGIFTSYNAKLEPAVAKEGEGMVLTLSLEGSGNLNNNILTLDLPDSFKYYDSKNYQTKNQSNSNTYSFEFIVQGLHKGDWEIKPQKFTFFDIKNRVYKTLETLPLAVSIMPSLTAHKTFVKPDVKPRESTAESAETIDELQPLHTGIWYNVDSRYLPFWLFLLLLCMPILMWILLGVKSYVRATTGSKERIGKNAFKTAYTQLEVAYKSQNMKSWYPIFIQLFAARYQVPASQVTQEFMQAKLVNAKMSSQELDAWNGFMNQLSEYIFFVRPFRSEQSAAIYQYARQWINKLEKII